MPTALLVHWWRRPASTSPITPLIFLAPTLHAEFARFGRLYKVRGCEARKSA